MMNKEEIIRVYEKPKSIDSVKYNKTDGEMKFVSDLEKMSITYKITAQELAYLLLKRDLPDGTTLHKLPSGFIRYEYDQELMEKEFNERVVVTVKNGSIIFDDREDKSEPIQYW